jgi:molybdenum cofactor biosynthesis protein MoaC
VRDISAKVKTLRTATARASIVMSPSTIEMINTAQIPKGDPLPVAKVAAIQAAKNTSQIIPYCHPLPVDFVGVEFTVHKNSIDIDVTVKAVYKTGVEMEALTAASVAALTIYDMTKMLDEIMEITSVKLLSKKGGKSDFRKKPKSELTAAVVVMSDTVSRGEKEDTSGKLIRERLEQEGLSVIDFTVVPDDQKIIADKLRALADESKVKLIVTTGGTGLGPRDKTPEAVAQLIEREIPGIAETIRSYGQERTPFSMLSRSCAGVRGDTIIINLAGSKNAVKESLDAIFPAVLHAFSMMEGACHDSHDKHMAKTK